MEEKVFDIKITPEDKDIYQFLKPCIDDESAKEFLRRAVELYQFCNYDSGASLGYLNPTLQGEAWKEETTEKLKMIRQELVDGILLYLSDFDPDECDCGFMDEKEAPRWFIDECGRLGFIVVYRKYIDEIDKLLKEREG